MGEEFKPQTEEEIRADVISDFKGEDEEFDPEDEGVKPRIDRIVAKRLKDEEMKASLHSQKTKRQEALKKYQERFGEIDNPDDKKSKGEVNKTDDDFETKFRQARDNEYLEDQDWSDEIKAKVKRLAKAEGISVKKAATDDYIKSLIEKDEEEKKSDKAGLTNNNSGQAKKSYSNMTADDFDVSTEEGRQEYAKWKKSQGQ